MLSNKREVERRALLSLISKTMLAHFGIRLSGSLYSFFFLARLPTNQNILHLILQFVSQGSVHTPSTIRTRLTRASGDPPEALPGNFFTDPLFDSGVIHFYWPFIENYWPFIWLRGYSQTRQLKVNVSLENIFRKSAPLHTQNTVVPYYNGLLFFLL